MVTNAHLKLGKGDVKHDGRTLALANYLTLDALRPAPGSIDWTKPVTNLGMMLNDTIGDCTIAGAGHAEQLWTANCGNQIIIPDAQILQDYEIIGGYNPANPASDNGCIALDVLNYWRNFGIGGRKISAYAAVQLKNTTMVQQTITLFGGLYLGLQMPVSAQNQSTWAVPTTGPVGTGAPGSWGGHMVFVVGYNPTYLTVITWGMLMQMSWSFLAEYGDESYAVLSNDWLVGGKKAPNGLAYKTLLADLRKVAS